MADSDMSSPKLDAEMILKLFAGLEVLKSQQSEINRRLGLLDKAVEDLELQDQEAAKGPDWMKQIWSAVLWVIGITLAVAVGRFFGVEVVLG